MRRPPSRIIFISYRRSDSAAMCDRIYGKLAEVFGKEAVFKDIEDIELGSNFKSKIEEVVHQSVALLAVIGPTWGDVTNADGQPRLSDPNDFVRIEVEYALQRGIPVIPLLVDGAKMPDASKLPITLQAFTLRNAAQVRYDPDFTHDMERVVEALEKIGLRKTTPKPDSTSKPLNGPQTPVPGGYYGPTSGAYGTVVYPSAAPTIVQLGTQTAPIPQKPPKKKRPLAVRIATPLVILAIIVGLCAGSIKLIGNFFSQFIPVAFTGSIARVQIVSSTEGWAVGSMSSAGAVLHYSSGAWSYFTVPGGTNGLTNISMISAKEGWAVGDAGTILHYTNQSWVAVASPESDRTIAAVSMASSSEGWAVGANGLILHYHNGSWQLYPNNPTSYSLDSIAMVSASSGWASGENSTILHYDGSRWTLVTSIQYLASSATIGATASLREVIMTTPSDGWIVGSKGIVLHLSHGIWQQVAQNLTTQGLGGVALNNQDNGWIVGDGGLIISCSGGDCSSSVASGSTTNLHSVALMPNDDAWAVGDNGTILQYSRSQNTWGPYLQQVDITPTT